MVLWVPGIDGSREGGVAGSLSPGLARNLKGGTVSKNGISMVKKEKLHLGQLVLVGAKREPAVIDGLAQTFAGVRLQSGGYEFCGYDDIRLEKGLEVPAYV